MKTIYLMFTVCLFMALGDKVNAQDSDGIYLIVNAMKYDSRAEAANNVVRSTYYNKEGHYRDTVKIFRAYVYNPYTNSKNKKVLELWHFYRIKPKAHETDINPQDQHKTFLKDCSFLNTVDCLYWDDVKDLSWGDAKDYIGPLLFHKMPDGKKIKRTIYVVDLAEKYPNGKIKLYQVQDMNKEWSRTIFIDENDKQEWVKHTKTVREKIDKRRVERKAKPFRK